MKLEAGPLILRTLTCDDIGEIARMWKYPDAISLAEAEDVLCRMDYNHSLNAYGAITHLCLGVFEAGNNRQLIGWCGLDGKIDPGNIAIFYKISPEFRCRGYATICARRILKYAFEEAGCTAVYGGCRSDNTASFRVMQKAGMHRIRTSGSDPLFMAEAKTYGK